MLSIFTGMAFYIHILLQLFFYTQRVSEVGFSNPAMLFLGCRVYTSSILLDTPAVLSKLIVTIWELLTHILPNTRCYQASAFSPSDKAKVDPLLVFFRFTWVCTTRCNFMLLLLVLVILPGLFFLFLHLAPSIFLHDSNQKFPWNPWWPSYPKCILLLSLFHSSTLISQLE